MKRCGARNKKDPSKTCQRWAMHGKRRCYLHGGKATGPKTPEGMARALSKLKRGKSGEIGQKLRKPPKWTAEELWHLIEGVD